SVIQPCRLTDIIYARKSRYKRGVVILRYVRQIGIDHIYVCDQLGVTVSRIGDLNMILSRHGSKNGCRGIGNRRPCKVVPSSGGKGNAVALAYINISRRQKL